MIAVLTPRESCLALSRIFRDHRIARQLTQAELAERSGVSIAVLRKFEQKGKISLESLVKIAFVLGLTDRLVRALRPQIPFASMDELLKANEAERPPAPVASRCRPKKGTHDR